MGRVARGVSAAIRARPGVFLGVAAAVCLLDVFLPPLVLSLTRKPVDFFMVNPWLKRLPEFLASSQVPLARKLGFLPGLTLVSFSADSPYGTEWGFAVDVSDLGRFLLSGALVGAYFALWLSRREQLPAAGPGMRLGRRGGTAGALTTVLGLTTGPCSVMGCGAPVIPVVGLAFVGLSSGTLALLALVSRVATGAVLLALAGGVVYLGWRVGGEAAWSRPVSPEASSSPLRSGLRSPGAPRR